MYHISILIAIHLYLLLCIFQLHFFDAKIIVPNSNANSKQTPKKSKSSTTAIPRSKSHKSNTLDKIFSNGLLKNVIRELKSSFSSDLEALTLQLTKPTEMMIQSNSLHEFVTLIDAEYDDPEFLVSILAKLSRKLIENNIYSKIKVIISLHLLVHDVSEKAQYAVLQCIKSLRNEHDSKVGTEFFSLDMIENVASSAATVGEVETLELAREYGEYAFAYFDILTKHLVHKKSLASISSSKTKKSHSLQDHYEPTEFGINLMNLLDQSSNIEAICKDSQSKLSTSCLDLIKKDRSWLITNLEKIYNENIKDDIVMKEMEVMLSRYDSEFKPKSIETSTEKLSTNFTEEKDEETQVPKIAKEISTPTVIEKKSTNAKNVTKLPKASPMLKSKSKKDKKSKK